MARIVMTLAEWKRIAHELGGSHRDAPPAGLHERLQALFAQAPQAWEDQPFAIELDDSSIDAVWAAHDIVTRSTQGTDDQRDSVAAAMRIVHNHQHRPDDAAPAGEDQT